MSEMTPCPKNVFANYLLSEVNPKCFDDKFRRLHKSVMRVTLYLQLQGIFMKTKSAALLAVALVFCGSTFAQTKTDTGINYNQIGVGYTSITTKISGKDYIFSGYALGGSFLVTPNIFLSASTSSATGDVFATQITTTQTNFSVGGRAKIAAQTDVYGEIGYIDAKVAAVGASVSDTGYGLTMGVKSAFTPSLVGDVFISNSKLSRYESSTSVGLGLDYYITPKVLIGGAYVFNNDTNQLGLSLSYAF